MGDLVLSNVKKWKWDIRWTCPE